MLILELVLCLRLRQGRFHGEIRIIVCTCVCARVRFGRWWKPAARLAKNSFISYKRNSWLSRSVRFTNGPRNVLIKGNYVTTYPSSRGPFDLPRKVEKRNFSKKIEGTSARTVATTAFNSTWKRILGNLALIKWSAISYLVAFCACWLYGATAGQNISPFLIG